MTPEDQLYRFRQRAIALAEELGSVPAAPWASTTRRSTAGSARPSATARGRERRHGLPNATSAVVRASSPSRWGTPASAPPASPPSWRAPAGEASDGVWRVLATPEAWSPATPPLPERPPPPSATWRSPGPESWSSSIASTSGASPAPGGPSGSTPPSTSPPPTPGRSCTSRRAPEVDLPARPPCRRELSARGWKLDRDVRQRLRVPCARRADGLIARAKRLHPRPSADQRLRRAGAGDHPRGGWKPAFARHRSRERAPAGPRRYLVAPTPVDARAHARERPREDPS